MKLLTPMKLLTTCCLVAGFLLCFLLVWLFGQVELPHQSRAARLQELHQMEATTCVLILCLCGAGFGAIAVVRTARKLYREEAMRNMQDLVEETKKSRRQAEHE